MRWKQGRRSRNVEDRRGGGMGAKAAGGGLATIVIVVIAMFLGVDPSQLLNSLGPVVSETPRTTQPAQRSPAEDQLADFVSVVLADTEDAWHKLFRQRGKRYQEPKLVLFTGAVQSACGHAQSAMGPFYCPGDNKVYIDLAFYRDLKNRHNAPGDFAQAYVIAHEVGHHVQNLLGISGQVHRRQQKLDKVQSNQLSVRLELQADCLAGVWAYHAHQKRQILEKGDIEEALGAASAIGDDRLQQQARGYVTPDSFTHGASAQRVRWFKKGINTGEMAQCDTFSATRL